MQNIFSWLLLYYLRFFTKISLFLNRPKIIGITGSVGKSSARNVIYAILKDSFKVRMIKEGNSETGIPLGVLGLDPGNYQITDWLRILILAPWRIFYLKNIRILIVEMGVDSPYPPKNMNYLLTIVKPDISVVLNAYPVHSEQFDAVIPDNLNSDKRVELITRRIAEEKAKIITQAKPEIGIFNGSDDNLRLIIKTGLNNKTKLLSFGEDKKNTVYYGRYDIDLNKSCFELIFPRLRSKKVNIEIKDYFLPKKYHEIISAGFLVGLSLGLDLEKIKKSLVDNFFLPVGRSSIFKGINDSVIIDSSYNASRAPVLTFIETAGYLAKKEKRPLVVLLGDMRELGKETEAEHKIVAKALKKTGIDNFYCVGELTKKYVLPEVSKSVKTSQWFENSVRLGEYLKTHLPYHSVVLVKGSQNKIFLEEAIKFILQDKEDEKKLCRQNSFWLGKKQSLNLSFPS
jgi:UDP-N-acetylmuramoyl-tripeptide--D-alanyl-D-alanine ligase